MQWLIVRALGLVPELTAIVVLVRLSS